MPPTTPTPPTDEQVAVFEAVEPLVKAAYDEVAALAKKNPMRQWSPTAKIIELLDAIKPVLDACEPGAAFLDPVDHTMANSDVAFTLKQWLTVMQQFRSRFYKIFMAEGSRPRWVTVENPPGQDF